MFYVWEVGKFLIQWRIIILTSQYNFVKLFNSITLLYFPHSFFFALVLPRLWSAAYNMLPPKAFPCIEHFMLPENIPSHPDPPWSIVYYHPLTEVSLFHICLSSCLSGPQGLLPHPTQRSKCVKRFYRMATKLLPESHTLDGFRTYAHTRAFPLRQHVMMGSRGFPLLWISPTCYFLDWKYLSKNR